MPKTNIMLSRKTAFKYDEEHDLNPRNTTPVGDGRGYTQFKKNEIPFKITVPAHFDGLPGKIIF